MGLIFLNFAVALTRRILILPLGTLFTTAVLARAGILPDDVVLMAPALLAIPLALRTSLEDVNGNLGWLLGAPGSRRSLWIMQYALNLVRAALVGVVFVTSLVVSVGLSKGRERPLKKAAVEHVEAAPSSTYAVFGFSSRPYTLWAVVMLNCLLMMLSFAAPGSLAAQLARPWSGLRAAERGRAQVLALIFVAYLVGVVFTPRIGPLFILNFVLITGGTAYYCLSLSMNSVRLPRKTKRQLYVVHAAVVGALLLYGVVGVTSEMPRTPAAAVATEE